MTRDRELRDWAEIQAAHDTLHAVVTGKVELPQLELTGGDRMVLMAFQDALCWVLQHGHGTSIAKNLAMLRKAIADAGYASAHGYDPKGTVQ